MIPVSRPPQQGFTLVEVLIALLVGGMVMAAVLTSFRGQHATYLAQDQVVEMQQNLRVALDMLTREIRGAGYDPTGRAGAGITTATPTRLVFTRDLDGSGGTYISKDDDDEYDPDERVSYQLNATPPALGRAIGNSDIHQPVADNILALEFVYLMADGTRTVNPAETAEIRGVQISLLARATHPDPNHTDSRQYIPASEVPLVGWDDDHSLPRDTEDLEADGWASPFNDGFRRYLLIQTIWLRNQGAGL